MTKLGQLFHSELRADVLRLLYGLRGERMYQAEIKGQLDYANRSVEEELRKLVALELVGTVSEKNRRYYWANRMHPLYPELRNIVLKTVGLGDVLKEALVSAKIEFAFIFGSLAALSENAASDVDLMVIGDLGLRELTPLLRGATEKIGREINAHTFSQEEWIGRVKKRDHFLRDVLDKPKLFIVGSDDEFAKLAG